MANVTCPVCGYQANGDADIINHMKTMSDDQHKQALKQKLQEKGAEEIGDLKNKL